MKKLIALALASAFTAPFALADVTIGGSARSALDYIDYGGTSNAKSSTRIADQSSRIWFRAEDKLDNGGTVFLYLENRFNIGGIGGSETTWGSRDTYLGYKSDLGLFAFGKRDNAYKLASGDYLQAFNAVFSDDASYYGKDQLLRRLGDRHNNVISYDSPSWGGFKVKASYDLDPAKTAAVNATTASLAASYSADKFSIGAAFAQANDQSKLGAKAANASTTGLQLGGTLNLGDGSISAVWERVNFDNGTSDADQDTYGVAASYKFGKFTVQGAYLIADDLDGVNNSGAQQFSLGGQYSLSKKSRVYLTYTRLDNDANAKFRSEAPGLSLANGNDVNIISLGVRSDF